MNGYIYIYIYIYISKWSRPVFPKLVISENCSWYVNKHTGKTDNLFCSCYGWYLSYPTWNSSQVGLEVKNLPVRREHEELVVHEWAAWIRTAMCCKSKASHGSSTRKVLTAPLERRAVMRPSVLKRVLSRAPPPPAPLQLSLFAASNTTFPQLMRSDYILWGTQKMWKAVREPKDIFKKLCNLFSLKFFLIYLFFNWRIIALPNFIVFCQI